MSAITGADRSGWKDNGDTDRIASEYTAVVREEGKTTYLISYRWREDDAVRITVSSETKFRPYGSGFVLRSHSIENADGVRYLRLYGDDGFFVRLIIEDSEIEAEEEEPEFTEPVQYLKDKMMTG